MLARHIALAPGSSRARVCSESPQLTLLDTVQISSSPSRPGSLRRLRRQPLRGLPGCVYRQLLAVRADRLELRGLGRSNSCAGGGVLVHGGEPSAVRDLQFVRLHQLGQYRNQTSYTIQQLALSIATYCGRNVSFDGEPASLSPAIAAQQTDPDVLSFRSALSTNTMLDQQTISFSADATISLEPTSVSRSVTSTSSAPVTSSASATSRTATLISSSSSSSAAPSASQTGAASSSLVRLGAGSLFGAVGVAALLV